MTIWVQVICQQGDRSTAADRLHNKITAHPGWHSGSHLNKKLLQILLELLGVGGDGHRADICVGRRANHQIFQTHTGNSFR